jgi:hypothetical protein
MSATIALGWSLHRPKKMRRTLQPCLGVSALSLLIAVAACAPAPVNPSGAVLETDCGYYFDDGSQTAQILSLEELPASVRARVVAHLRSRLGTSLYSQISISGGQVLDSKAMSERRAGATVSGTTAAKYILHFRLTVPGLVAGYCAQMEVDKDGRVTKEIALPGAARDPKKASIVPIDTAIGVAALHGVPRDQAAVRLAYDRSSDSLIWLVSQLTESNASGFKRVVARINAHTGKFLGWDQEEGRFSKSAETSSK